MKILILGHGAVGSVLAKLLHEEKEVKSVICADISFKGEKKFKKFHHMNISLENKAQLLNILKKHKPDLVVNASSPTFNVEVFISYLEPVPKSARSVIACVSLIGATTARSLFLKVFF